MNIKELHTRDKAISTAILLKTDSSNATAIQILKGEQFKEHISKTSVLLLCIEGEAVFENEKGSKEKLSQGDYVHIEPMTKHWIDGITDCQLILIR